MHICEKSSQMENWQKYEFQVVEALKIEFASFANINVVGTGGSDSTNPDVKIYHENAEVLNLELKLSPAQAGQFVIIKQNSFYTKSTQNKFDNFYSDSILNYINNNFEFYESVNQNGINLECDKELLYNWVKEHYKNKKSKFLITSNKVDSFLYLIDIENLDLHFSVSAVVRRKKSGSRALPKKYHNEALEILRKHLGVIGVILNEFTIKGKKLLIRTNIVVSNANKYIQDSVYYLSNTENDCEYEVKVLSKTNNVNIVFSIEFLNNSEPISMSDLRKKLLETIGLV